MDNNEIEYCECGCMLVDGVPVDSDCECLTKAGPAADYAEVELPEDAYPDEDELVYEHY